MTAEVIAVLATLVAGLVAFIVQTIRLANAKNDLLQANNQVGVLGGQLATEKQVLAAVTAGRTADAVRATAQLNALQQRLTAAENALAQNAPPRVVGAAVRDVLDGKTDPVAPSAASGSGMPPPAAPGR